MTLNRKRARAMLVYIVADDEVVETYKWEGGLDVGLGLSDEGMVVTTWRAPDEISTMTVDDLNRDADFKTGPEYGPQIMPSMQGKPVKCDRCGCGVFTLIEAHDIVVCNGCKATYEPMRPDIDPNTN